MNLRSLGTLYLGNAANLLGWTLLGECRNMTSPVTAKLGRNPPLLRPKSGCYFPPPPLTAFCAAGVHFVCRLAAIDAITILFAPVIGFTSTLPVPVGVILAITSIDGSQCAVVTAAHFPFACSLTAQLGRLCL